MSKVDLQKFSKEELEKIVNSSFTKTELAIKLGFSFSNGKVSKKIVDLVNSFNISIDHFDRFKKVKDKRKQFITIKECPVCSAKFETDIRVNTATCSYKCSNSYFADKRYTPESAKKISDSINEINKNNGTFRDIINKICPVCKNTFQTIKIKKVYV